MKRTGKYIVVITLAVFTAFAASVGAHAASPDELLSDFSAVIPDKYGESLGNPEDIGDRITPTALRELILGELTASVPAALELFLLTLGIIILGALCKTYKGSLSSAVGFALSCVSMSVLVSKSAGLFSAVTASIREASDFFGSVVPIFCAINASGGGAATAGAQGLGMSVTVSLCTAVVSRILPFIAAVVYSLDMLSVLGAECRLGTSAKNLYTKILGILTLVISLFMTMQSVVASASDSAAMRTAKYGVASLIPVVGGTVSSSLGLLSGGLAYVKSITGVSAVMVLVGIFLSPLILLLLYRLSLSVCQSLELTVSGGKSIITPTLGLLDCIIASYALCVLLYIFEIVLFMKYGLVL